MPVVRINWPVYSGDGRADRIESHTWARVAGEPENPKRWLYICGPNSAADQIITVGDGRCFARPVRDSRSREYSHCFEFPDGRDAAVKDLVDVLEVVRTIAPRDHIDYAFVLDWYKVPPEPGIESSKWSNTPAGELINRGKYWKDRSRALELVDIMVDLIQRHPLMAESTIVTVPGSTPNEGSSFGEKLASTVRKRAGMPIIRTLGPPGGHTPRKSEDGQDRSLIGTFSMPEPIRGPVVVIDDVVRTGDSISAVGLAARQAGASRVYAFAAVKTMKYR